MSAPRRVRWECPSGTHPAVLGPTRPPKDATVRFCLPCSAIETRLVQRVAPALDRERAAKAAKAVERTQAKRDRERERQRERYVVSTSDGVTLNLRDEMDSMLKRSPELRDCWRQCAPSMRWRPEFVVRRGEKAHVSGRAWTSGRMVLTVGAGADSHEVLEVLLHELCHIAQPHEHHGTRFRVTLCRAARELFGTTVHPNDHREAYGLDRLIVEQMRALAPGR
jgi:hypothetical protein